MAMIQSLQGNALAWHIERGKKNVLTPSLLMELKAKGVFVPRGDHQPFNVGSSSSKLHLTIHSPPAVIFKMASLLCLQPEKPHV